MSITPTGRHPYLRSGAPLALAHRGDTKSHPPGNTWAAFESAVELGFRYLETDVQATKDGVLVLFHDDRLEGVTTGRGAVGDHRWTELADVRYRAGGRVTDQGLVPLEELLARWPEVRLNLDAKTEPTVAPLVQIVERFEALDRVCLASFDRASIERMRRQAGPDVCTILSRREVAILRGASFLPMGARVEGRAAQIPVRYRHIPLVDARLVRAAHDAGIDVHVWTVDDPTEMHRLLDLGVDGLISNDPAALKRALIERGEWES